MSTHTRNITPTFLRQMKQMGKKIACLTVYDASFARILEESGVEVLLVGDSLGMVIQGYSSTLPVTMDSMVYHTSCVARGVQHSLLVADLPFLSYTTPAQAIESAGRLMAAGAHMVKLEGGIVLAEIVRCLSQWGIPVCAHLGLLPQSVHKLGGYRVQGRSAEQATEILDSAKKLEEAGADLLIVECVPALLGQQLAAVLKIPVIGIGAGPKCDGQVLVLYDLLGIALGKRPKFTKNFLSGNDGIQDAVLAFVAEVKASLFPGSDHSFS
ncbi:3-methyl-2-oxobutanoate hydroxymethyltransferase [Gammaproteobacteria bacterium]